MATDKKAVKTTRSNPHQPYHNQKWTQITKYRRALPKEAYRSLRYYETCAVVDFAGNKSYKIITVSENCIHFLDNGTTRMENNDVIYFGDIISIGCVNETSELFDDTATNLNSQMITIMVTDGKSCELHTVEERTKLMFHVHAAWRTYTDRKSMGLGIAISTGTDNGGHNRKLYEEIEAEILTIDPQNNLLDMQKSTDLLYELSKAILHDRTIKQCFFESMSLVYFLLQQLSRVHATNLRDFNRVSQLKYAMSLYTLLQSALFNSHTIDARLNMIDPSPFSFVGMIEIICLDFRPASGFDEKKKYVKAKQKYEKKMNKKKIKYQRHALQHRDRSHFMNTPRDNSRPNSPRNSPRNSSRDSPRNSSRDSPRLTARSSGIASARYSEDMLSEPSHSEEEYSNSDDEENYDSGRRSTRRSSKNLTRQDYTNEHAVSREERHRLLGPSVLLSNSHRRSPTKHHLWSHAPKTVDESEENHVRHHHAMQGKEVEHIGHHVHASSSDESSGDDDDGFYLSSEPEEGDEDYEDEDGIVQYASYTDSRSTRGLLQSIRHAYDSNVMNADRHEYNHDEEHHKTTKSILDGGIVLLKSSMDHKSLQHAAKRVASKEARLYGEEFHRK